LKHLAFVIVALIGFSQNDFAQDTPEKYAAHNKGKFFVNWGGNRESYSKSDITFWGNGYHFTLADVRAHDKPKGLHIDYFDPARMTIPQTNFRIGYYFTDHYSLSLGVDHMKYVMTQNQVAEMTGTISGNEPFNGEYQNHPMVLTAEFLKFEHTDGLNYVNTELTRLDDVTPISWNIDKVQINTVVGAGIGLLYPKTNTTLMGKERHDQFHVAGYGTGVKAGLNLTFFKHYFIQSEIKGGYINMPDIRTTFNPDDHAKQHFTFAQWNLVVGGIFRV
jgi:hypothetical protein